LNYILFTLLLSCNASQAPIQNIDDLAPVIIYKTKFDYYYYVPVTLNNDKNRIVSYPAPGDLYYEGALALPVKLENDFLLDRRGLGTNSAFTSFTYEEYSKLKSAPSHDVLYRSIIDKDPFLVLFDCGTSLDYRHLVKNLNKKIKKGNLECQSLL